jgi:hypothetical protein
VPSAGGVADASGRRLEDPPGGGRVEALSRAVEMLPGGSVWLGLGLAIVIAFVYAAWLGAFGSLETLRSDEHALAIAPGTRFDLVIAALIAFLVAAGRYAARRSPVELVRLQPLTCCTTAEFAAIIAQRVALRRSRLWLVSGLGALFGLAVIVTSAATPAPAGLPAAQAYAQLAWRAVASMVLFALMARVAYESVVDGRVLARITREIREIQLLDREALAPFALHGLRRAFLWVGGSSIASLLALDIQRPWPLFAILTATLCLATLAFVGPARAIRSRVRSSKRAELRRVREEIERTTTALLSASAPEEVAQLPALLAYEARIEAVAEWPFDTSTLLRFGALAILASGSWLGGALVERLLGTLLD